MKNPSPHGVCTAMILTLFALMLTACEGEINRNDNAYGDEPYPESSDPENNDDFFHAFSLNLPVIGSTLTRPDSLSETDLVDYFVVNVSNDVYRSYSFELKNLTGDADLELYNAYSGKESWSENSGNDDEKIDYWRGYFDSRANYVFLKVTNRSGTALNYNLEIN